jgi:hypothetical protein
MRMLLRRAALALLAAVMLSARPTHADAQTSVTVIGVVVDAGTGTPVSAARVSLGIGAPGTATNALGRFTLENVPVGSRKLVVTRLGYQDHEVVIEITDPMGGVRIAIAPDPLQLEGVSTKGATEGPLRGRVIDAETGEAVPWAPITLTRDGVKAVSRRLRSTDADGNFEIPDVALGQYLLKVERPDYAPQLMTIAHQVPEPPLQITLRRDYRRQAALRALSEKLDVRLNSTGGSSVAVNAAALQSTAMRFMDQLMSPSGFEPDALARSAQILDPMAVAGGDADAAAKLDLPQMRGPLTVYVDGYEQPPVALQTYSPKEFYRVDYLACPTGGKRFMLAYTYSYIEDRMINPAKRDPIQTVCTP